jgi:SulP family sulfate permease
MDVSAARAVETIATDAVESGKHVYVTGLREEVSSVLAGLDADHHLPADTRFKQRIDAVRQAVEDLERGRIDAAPNGAAPLPA